MQYLAGALYMALLFVALIYGYHTGRKQRPKPKEPDETEEIRTEKLKAARLRQDFQRMMSYDVSKAYGKRVE